MESCKCDCHENDGHCWKCFEDKCTWNQENPEHYKKMSVKLIETIFGKLPKELRK